ncbi:MAG: 4Fe-4S binding protein [Candidatus Bathyarchaeota archaeon]|nr:MAG: 4Fe-4S binding protein [Candidatus Bathyarchaeota archaeon]
MRLQRLRVAIQSLFFLLSNLGFSSSTKTGLCVPFLYCYGCPLASAACPIGTLQHFVILPAIPLYLIGLIGLFGTLLGRAFCGWACPFGAFQDLLGSFNSKRRRLRPFKYSKFIMLVIVIVLAWITVDTFFCKFCPAGSLFAAIPAPFFFPTLNLGVFFFVHIATLILTIGLVFFFSRFWCRYLCPVAPIGLFNRFSLLTISLDPEKCTKCLKCLANCPMELEQTSDIGHSSDCLLCGRCVEACNIEALQIRLRGK